MAGGLVAGGSSGLLSVYIVGMRIPFLGVCVAHAALAGAVFGALAGIEGPMLLLPALAGAVVTALPLGLADPRTIHMDANVIMGLLFSVTMGLAFVGFGLFGVLGRSDNDVRSLLWGSLTYCRWRDVGLMLAAAAALGLFVLAFGKEMRAILFSRTDAQAAGIRATAVWTGFLILTAVLMTVNFQTVGGLMIYSLITNPAAAAFQLVRGTGRAIGLAVIFGAVSGLGGFLLSAVTDLPSGAVIVLLSALLVAFSACARRMLK
ncbi:MAG: metal ABC transporter permease [Planctomycetes bacterium]|nr:metal ABC transporter permease [Planctomycetota bacterium]